MHARGIEFQAGLRGCNRKPGRHARGELDLADPYPRETDAAEIVDALDVRSQQIRRRRPPLDEFRAPAALDIRIGRQFAIAAVERDRVAAYPRLAPAPPRRNDVHAGRADEIAD